MSQPEWPTTGPGDPLFESAHRPAVLKARDLALALPGTGEKIMRGHLPTMTVGGKNFAIFWRQHHRPSVCLNAGSTVQHALTHADRGRYFVPAYMGPRGWIGVRLDVEVDWTALEQLVAEAHEFAKPAAKRQRRKST